MIMVFDTFFYCPDVQQTLDMKNLRTLCDSMLVEKHKSMIRLAAYNGV
jgi:hypothetical protein